MQLPVTCLILLLPVALCQYEDVRCKCICPSTSVVGNKSKNGLKQASPEDPSQAKSGQDRKLYIGNVSPLMCNCEGVVMPNVLDPTLKPAEFCPRCECKYETRNTRTIRVCVILIIWIVSLLTLYMGFLRCLDPLLNKRRTAVVKYEEHTNEDVTLGEFAPDGNLTSEEPQARTRRSGSGVLDKVGAQQDKWKRQVQEQRRNIYDKRTMLN